jgi:ABC-type transport system involved in multi-copper enzyme maturation permease subunit
MLVRLGAIAGSVFMDAVRRRVVYLVGFFGFIMALAIPSLPSYGMGVAIGVYREVSLALTFAASLALTLALAANRLPGEIERRTLYNVLAKPVHRLEYLVGTWLGIFAMAGAMIVGFTVVEQVVGLVRYQDAMWRLWQGALAIWLETGVVAAIAVSVSAVTGPVVVVIASVTAVFVGHSREGALSAGAPAIVRALYPSLDTFNVINPVAHGTGIGPVYTGAMLLSFFGWIGVVLLLGVAGFKRRDL